MDTDRQLKENHVYVKLLAQSISEGKSGIEGTARMYKVVMKKGSWHAFKNEFQEEVRPADYKAFIESQYPEGVGISFDILEKLIKDDPEALSIHTHEKTAKHGGDHMSEEYKSKSYNINLATKGTSKEYGLRKLRKDREDLHERVIQGELSVNKAMIEAGYRKKKVRVNIDSGAVVKMILKNFSKEDITDIIGMLRGE